MITMVRNLYYKIIKYYNLIDTIFAFSNKKTKKRFNKSTKELFVVINFNYLLRENKIPKKTLIFMTRVIFKNN
jgi:hypothetical protein